VRHCLPKRWWRRHRKDSNLIVNYGYQDASGTWLITVDTDKCDGCGKCADACPAGVLEIIPNEYDPLEQGLIPSVSQRHKKEIKYSCSPCKPTGKADSEIMEPCIEACKSGAISHSW